MAHCYSGLKRYIRVYQHDSLVAHITYGVAAEAPGKLCLWGGAPGTVYGILDSWRPSPVKFVSTGRAQSYRYSPQVTSHQDDPPIAGMLMVANLGGVHMETRLAITLRRQCPRHM
jgi:hypothetical protein